MCTLSFLSFLWHASRYGIWPQAEHARVQQLDPCSNPRQRLDEGLLLAATYIIIYIYPDFSANSLVLGVSILS